MSSRVCVTGYNQKPWYIQSCLCDWVIKGPGMSSRACATGHIKDPVPLIEKWQVVGFLLVSFI